MSQNKWNRPAAPPPPLFFGKKERDLVKQVNDELIEKVIDNKSSIILLIYKQLNFMICMAKQ